MKHSKIGVGIVGIGFGQHVLLPAFAQDPRCQVTAICASNDQRAMAVAKKNAIQSPYGDWRKLIDSATVNAIAIATPPALQSEIVTAAMAAGKPVFCEKPLATSLAKASSVAAAAKLAGLANMVDFEFPEISVWQECKRILTAGGVGRVRHFTVNWNVETYVVRERLNSWKTQRRLGGGTLNLFVSHVFHYLEWFFGPITELCCQMFVTTPGAAQQDLSETLVNLSCTTADHVSGTVTVSTDAFLGTGHSLEVYGEEGTVLLRNETPDYIKGFRLLQGTRAAMKLNELSATESTSSQDGRLIAVGKLVRRFIDWVESGRPEGPDFQDGLRVQQLLDCAVRSNESGQKVNCGLCSDTLSVEGN